MNVLVRVVVVVVVWKRREKLEKVDVFECFALGEASLK